jgi:hypothetical protein
VLKPGIKNHCRGAQPMSQMGLVSRVTPVQTALRNCTRDEGRSFEVGNQVLRRSQSIWDVAGVHQYGRTRTARHRR